VVSSREVRCPVCGKLLGKLNERGELESRRGGLDATVRCGRVKCSCGGTIVHVFGHDRASDAVELVVSSTREPAKEAIEDRAGSS